MSNMQVERRRKSKWRKFCELFTSRTVDDADMAEILSSIESSGTALDLAVEECGKSVYGWLSPEIKSAKEAVEAKLDEKIKPDTTWRVNYTATFGEDRTPVEEALKKIVGDKLGDIRNEMEEEWVKATAFVERLERVSGVLGSSQEKIQSLSGEIEELRRKCTGLEQDLEARSLELEQCRSELDAEKGKVEALHVEKDGLETALNEELEKGRKELAEAEARHEEEKARIEAENEKTRKELTEEHAKAIEGLRQAKDAEIAGLVAERDGIAEKVKSQIEEMLPKRYCDLFGVEFGATDVDGMKEARVQCLFAYLILLKSNLRGALQFANRFQEFDRVVGESLCDEPKVLEEVRCEVEKDVLVWAGKAGFEVSWAKEGDAFDSNIHKTTGTMGQTVEKAVTATVWQTDGNGVRKCIAKGEVETR